MTTLDVCQAEGEPGGGVPSPGYRPVPANELIAVKENVASPSVLLLTVYLEETGAAHAR